MKVYLIRYKIVGQRGYFGDELWAWSMDDAQSKADELGVTLDGELLKEIEL